MRIVDLTHKIKAEMPVYPGTEPPVLQQANTMEKDGFVETKLTLYSHTGTHMDAPAHMLEAGVFLEEQEAGRFVGNATVLDFTGWKSERIGLEEMAPYEEKIKKADFVILKTGWAKLWGSEAYFKGFPALSLEAARWLSGFSLKGIGVDTISIDVMGSNTMEVHKQLLSNNINIIENLTNLDEVEQETFLFCCLPLKFQESDGAPVRAVAIEDRS